MARQDLGPITISPCFPHVGCCVWRVCVKVFWEEPFKMMCTINVTVGRLHFRGIDLLLVLTERPGSRGDSKSGNK